MDTEEIADNINSNLSHRFNASDLDIDERHPMHWQERLYLELYTLSTLISIIVNILIVFMVLKFRKLRQQVTYIIIVHLSVVEGVYMFCTPLILRVFTELQLLIPIKAFCILNELECAIFGAVQLLLVLLICDWYIKVYTSEPKYEKFSRIYKFFLAFIYLMLIVSGSVTIPYCLKGRYRFSIFLIITLLFISVVILSIVMNIVHRFKRRKLANPDKINNTGLAIVNIFISTWIPAISLVLLSFAGLHSPWLIIIFTALGFTSPTLNLVYLYLSDGQFNLFFKKVVRCRCNDYQNEDLDDQPVVYNEVTGVNI